MTVYELAKSMTRSLTDDEQRKILTFWSENKEMPIVAVIEHWEKILQMPITKTAVAKAMVRFGHEFPE